jgi:glycosyltransferase involved in cell wall biosynthesis
MKKIVIDAREYSTSTGRYVRKLLEYLEQVDTNPSHRYIVLLKPKDMETYQPKSKRFIKQVCRWKEFGFGEQLGLAWQLYRQQPDIVHFGMTQQPVLYFGKTVTTIHDLTTTRFRNPTKNKYVFWIKQQVYILLTKYVARKSAVVITPTEFVREDVAKFANINSRKIVATYEAVDPFDVEPEPIADLVDKDFIVYNGRPLPHKNLRRLMKAFALVHTSTPDLLLVIAGKKDASFRSYERLAKKLEISEYIVFTDFIPDGQLAWVMSNAKAYVYPSLSEGFGLPGLEAMQYGAPLISSNATCLPEVYGDAAEYFEPRDIADIAAKIQKVLGSEKRQKELIGLGKKQITKYSWKRMAEQTFDVYKTVLREEHVN